MLLGGVNGGLAVVQTAGSPAMLKQRVLTALILAAALLAALLWLPPSMLAGLFGVVVLAAAWEWADLCGWSHPFRRTGYVLAVAVALVAAGLYTGLPGQVQLSSVRSLLGLAGLWWALALLWVKTYPGSALLWRHPLVRAGMGILTLVPAWVALAYLRLQSQGAGLIVLVVALVAAADIGAYFVGRAWGRAKLAPRVSPGKSWNGFWGGLTAALLLALAVWALALRGHVEPQAMAVIALLTVPASVLGDLLESMLKRHRGVKDSGGLLPGHGGVLDRLDSMTAAAPVFALLWLLLAL